MPETLSVVSHEGGPYSYPFDKPTPHTRPSPFVCQHLGPCSGQPTRATQAVQHRAPSPEPQAPNPCTLNPVP